MYTCSASVSLANTAPKLAQLYLLRFEQFGQKLLAVHCFDYVIQHLRNMVSLSSQCMAVTVTDLLALIGRYVLCLETLLQDVHHLRAHVEYNQSCKQRDFEGVIDLFRARRSGRTFDRSFQ